MKYILSTFIFSILLISCASTKKGKDEAKSSNKETEFKDVEEMDSLFAYIRRGACLGNCPTYELKIYNSGFAELNGTRAVDLIGKYTATISKDKMHTLTQKAIEIGYFEMEDVYDNQMVTDLPETKTSIVKDGKRKEILCRYNYPKKIVGFEKLFDAFIESEKWTKVSSSEK